MYDLTLRHWIFHTESDLLVFIMKPDVEISSPIDGNGNEFEEEQQTWSVSVTNLPNDVFEDENAKKMFEKLFSHYGSVSDTSFIYLKTFHRARVTFNNEENAKEAKKNLHGHLFLGYELGVFLVQRRSSLNNNSNLKPPPLTKQFLISPPASPPVGWEQTLESHPVINYDLLAAVATLDTSQPYQLHTSAEDAPSIVVHLCDEEEDEDVADDEGSKFHPLKALPREVTQTRRPGRKV